MPFSTNCTNKGCYEFQEPYLDLNDNKVYCSKCENEIVNITTFTKNQLKANKQFKLQKKENNVFKCLMCNKDNKVILLNKEIVCNECKGEMKNLTPFFKETLKKIILNSNKDA